MPLDVHLQEIVKFRAPAVFLAHDKPKRAAQARVGRISYAGNAMAGKNETQSNNRLPAQTEDMERIVIRLLDVAFRCENAEIKHDLMKLADDLARVVETSRQGS